MASDLPFKPMTKPAPGPVEVPRHTPPEQKEVSTLRRLATEAVQFQGGALALKASIFTSESLVLTCQQWPTLAVKNSSSDHPASARSKLNLTPRHWCFEMLLSLETETMPTTRISFANATWEPLGTPVVESDPDLSRDFPGLNPEPTREVPCYMSHSKNITVPLH